MYGDLLRICHDLVIFYISEFKLNCFSMQKCESYS